MAYAFSNVPLVFIGAALPTAAGTYGMITPGSYIFAVADEGKPVVVTYTAQNLTGFPPNLTPVYTLTDARFRRREGQQRSGASRARRHLFVADHPATRSLESRLINMPPCLSKFEIRARSRSSAPASARPSQRTRFATTYIIGPVVAQTILQRELYVRTKFTFKLSWEYCLLDPMDVVTITDANLGLSNYPVRIVDDRGGRQGPARRHRRGARDRRLDAGLLSERGDGGYQPNQGVPARPRQHAADLRAAAGGDGRRRANLGRRVRRALWLRDRNGAGPTSMSRSTTSPIRNSRSITAAAAPGLLDRGAAGRPPAGIRPTRWRSASPKAAGR